jgi:hypothetical protein
MPHLRLAFHNISASTLEENGETSVGYVSLIRDRRNHLASVCRVTVILSAFRGSLQADSLILQIRSFGRSRGSQPSCELRDESGKPQGAGRLADRGNNHHYVNGNEVTLLMFRMEI